MILKANALGHSIQCFRLAIRLEQPKQNVLEIVEREFGNIIKENDKTKINNEVASELL